MPCGYFTAKYLASKGIEPAKKRKKYYGTPDYTTADNLLLGGWSKGAREVLEFMQQKTVNAHRPQTFNNVHGYACNVGAYLSGSPLCMFDRNKVKAPARVVRIAYNSSCGCNVEAKDIQRAAARLFNVISGLQKSGISVELWAVDFTKKNEEQINCAVKVKSAGDPFNVLQMVYPIVHPSFLRRHMLALTERAGVVGDWGHYGHPVVDRDGQLAALKALNIFTENVFSYYSIAGKTESEILSMIK